jgi:plasmid stabilization system protein ParE
MAEKAEIFWTEHAISDLDSIYNYLLITWSAREAENFLDLVQEFLRVIVAFPKAFPSSAKYRTLRSGLCHRNVSVIYRVKGNKIEIIRLLDNRSQSKYR